MIPRLMEAGRHLYTLGTTEVLKKEVSVLHPIWLLVLEDTFNLFIWGGEHMPRRKRETNSYFLKCCKIVEAAG